MCNEQDLEGPSCAPSPDLISCFSFNESAGNDFQETKVGGEGGKGEGKREEDTYISVAHQILPESN